MAQIFDEGNVIAHIPNGSKEPYARCYDARDEDFRTLIVIDLFTFYRKTSATKTPITKLQVGNFSSSRFKRVSNTKRNSGMRGRPSKTIPRFKRSNRVTEK